MPRKELAENELVAIINSELAKRENCTGCRVNAIMSLAEPDENGCNWSEPHISCSGVPARACLPDAAQVIASVRESYNLK